MTEGRFFCHIYCQKEAWRRIPPDEPRGYLFPYLGRIASEARHLIEIVMGFFSANAESLSSAVIIDIFCYTISVYTAIISKGVIMSVTAALVIGDLMKKYRFTEEEQSFYEHLKVPRAVYQFVNKRVAPLAISEGFCRIFPESWRRILEMSTAAGSAPIISRCRPRRPIWITG